MGVAICGGLKKRVKNKKNPRKTGENIFFFGEVAKTVTRAPKVEFSEDQMAHHRKVGYAYLREALGTNAFEPAYPARVYPVQKFVRLAEVLQVPESAAPAADATPLEHLLFALKHEDLDLQAAVLALQKIPAQPLVQQFAQTPGGRYLQQACFLWELAHRQKLDAPEATGPTRPLFDPAVFLTGPSRKFTRWRVDFNGIGSPHYSPSVRLTPEIKALLAQDILGQARAFIGAMDPDMVQRAVRWAYLSETEGSFAIERETPTGNRAEAFARLLSRAHEEVELTEDYLVELQNLTVLSAMDQAVQYRVQQNWLRRDMSVTYVPPAPEHLLPIMEGLLDLANQKQTGIPPLVLGSLVSFGFVFAHPFMDGNGRLSRFLFHKIACRDADLPNGLVLPISMAMARHEDRYLQALCSFSALAREQWTVAKVSDMEFDCRFDGAPEIYHYWDATSCVQFGLEMAQEALQHDLHEEVQFLHQFDRVYARLNREIDMNNNLMNLLARLLVQSQGTLSTNKRKMFMGKGCSAEVLDEAQRIARTALSEEDEDEGMSA